MKSTKEDNTIFVLQRAVRHFKIKVSDSTIAEFLLSHPYYPTLKSVCDALKKWRIDYYPLKLELDEIRELKVPFIAHLKIGSGLLVFVEGITDQVSYIAHKGKIQKESFEVFAEKISGAVILIEKDKISGEKDYRQERQNEVLNQNLLPLSIIAILFFLISNLLSNLANFSFQVRITIWGLLLSKFLGIIASIFLTIKEMKISSKLTEKICHFSSQIDCDAVLSSPVSRLFGWVSWADIGLIYFLGTLIFFLGTVEDVSLYILAIISAFSLPYPIFSIYYQSIKLKKWCPFCLLVQFILVFEFAILFPCLNLTIFNGVDILKFLTSILVPGIGWLLFKALLKKTHEQEKEHITYLKIKRDPAVFHLLLYQNGYTEFKDMGSSLVLGDPKAPIRLVAFLNLYCNSCTKAFKQLKSLIESCLEIRVDMIFSIYQGKEFRRAINALYYLYLSEGSNAAIKFLDIWYAAGKDTRRKLINSITLPVTFNRSGQIETLNRQLFEIYHIEGVPTVYVDGYKFPDSYDYDILEYYIEDIQTIIYDKSNTGGRLDYKTNKLTKNSQKEEGQKATH